MDNSLENLIKKLYLQTDKIIQNSSYSKEKIASTVKDLSDIFNTRDKKIFNYMETELFRIAYLAYFYPINVYKCLHILSFYREYFINKKFYFDLGAGPLTFYTACALAKIRADKFFAHDKNIEILQLGKYVIGKLSKNISDNILFSLPYPNIKINVIFLGNIISEIRENEIIETLSSSLKICEPKNNLIIILEPGTKAGFQNILFAKNLLKERGYQFLNTCPTETCPLTEKDWCHENLIFPRSQFIEYIENKTGLDNRFINFTYGIFSSSDNKILNFDENTYRVVSNLLDRKGEYAIYLCCKQGLQLFSLLKRHITNQNKDFIRLRRGDIVQVKNFNTLSKIHRLNENSQVLILKKFDNVIFS
ncbi:MAG: hypothetical protein N2202_09660 [Proteobacteria bacterium]|nr:hypothetical protein [Pseudomonadota bacterium]